MSKLSRAYPMRRVEARGDESTLSYLVHHLIESVSIGSRIQNVQFDGVLAKLRCDRTEIVQGLQTRLQGKRLIGEVRHQYSREYREQNLRCRPFRSIGRGEKIGEEILEYRTIVVIALFSSTRAEEQREKLEGEILSADVRGTQMQFIGRVRNGAAVLARDRRMNQMHDERREHLNAFTGG